MKLKDIFLDNPENLMENTFRKAADFYLVCVCVFSLNNDILLRNAHTSYYNNLMF